MRRILLLILLVLAPTASSAAETRWCDVTGRGQNDTIIYPPIARAARVSGLVMGYLKFTPDGKVTGFEPILGPAMLRESLRQQFSTWTLQTRSTGTEACQALVVAKFELCGLERSCEDDPSCPNDSAAGFEPSIVRIHTRSPITWICDPAGTLSYGNPVRHAWYSTSRAVRKLFRRQP
jgi:hypothetical protein